MPTTCTPWLIGSVLLSFFGRIYTVRQSTPLLRNCDREIRTVRRAEDADRHVSERVRRCLFARADRAGALPRDVAKRATERAEASPARPKRDLGDRQFRVAEQRRRALDPPREQVPMRRDTERLFERACEVRGGDAAHAREPTDGPLLVGRRVHSVLRAQ